MKISHFLSLRPPGSDSRFYAILLHAMMTKATITSRKFPAHRPAP
jgi:hypothetical protein